MRLDKSDVPWKTCEASGCTGIRYEGIHCVVHSPDKARDAALSSLQNGEPLTWTAGLGIDAGLMAAIIDALPQDSEGHRTLPDVDFRSAKFFGPAQFASCSFVGNADFTNCEIVGGAEFGAARFASGCSFEGATIIGRAFFKQARIKGRASFQNITCHGIGGFNLNSAEAVDFSGAVFRQTSLFQGDFEKVVLDRCRFEGVTEIDFCSASDLFSIQEAVFSKRPKCLILKSERGIDLHSVTFETSFDIKLQSGSIRASRLRTSERGRVEFLGDLDMGELDAGAPLLIEPAAPDVDRGFDPKRFPPRVVSLRHSDVANVSISNVDLGPCLFTGAHGLDRLELEGALFAQPPTSWRRSSKFPTRWTRRQTIAEEHLWRETARHGTEWYAENDRVRPVEGHLPSEWIPDPPKVTAGQIATTYRALRKGREDSRDAPGGADFYYGEMEMRRNAGNQHDNEGDRSAVAASRSVPLAERWILKAYWFVSGYGLRASRALACLLIIVLSAAIGLDDCGFEDDENYLGSVLFAVESSISLLRPSSEDLTTSGEFLEIALRLIGPLLVGLALLSVRGRVKR